MRELPAIPAQWTLLHDEARALVAHLGAPPGATIPLFPAPPGGRAHADLAPLATALAGTARGAAIVVVPAGRRFLPPPNGALLSLGEGAWTSEAARPGLYLLLVLDAPEASAKGVLRACLQEAFAGTESRFEALAALATMWRKAFTGLDVQVTELLAEGDTVVALTRAGGVHSGLFYNVPATDTRASWRAAFVAVVRDGRVVEVTPHWDLIALLKELRAAWPRRPNQ